MSGSSVLEIEYIDINDEQRKAFEFFFNAVLFILQPPENLKGYDFFTRVLYTDLKALFEKSKRLSGIRDPRCRITKVTFKLEDCTSLMAEAIICQTIVDPQYTYEGKPYTLTLRTGVKLVEDNEGHMGISVYTPMP